MQYKLQFYIGAEFMDWRRFKVFITVNFFFFSFKRRFRLFFNMCITGNKTEEGKNKVTQSQAAQFDVSF